MSKFKHFRKMLFIRSKGDTVKVVVGKETAYLLDIS